MSTEDLPNDFFFELLIRTNFEDIQSMMLELQGI